MSDFAGDAAAWITVALGLLALFDRLKKPLPRLSTVFQRVASIVRKKWMWVALLAVTTIVVAVVLMV